MENLERRLLESRIGGKRHDRSIKPLYGNRTFVTDLDIINELGGHTGCVNALNWSSNGSLLASGSDDTYLNIWDYNPTNLAKPFTLNTSVSTGHHANIFSVKFMPHSSDRTVITCAGDSEVRIFDLEYGGNVSSAGDTSNSSTRSRRFNNFFGNARWLNEGNTNARVYRSHADRVKRIVTESSPHLFLTCSEDGEVRQWDLRQPSSAYPTAQGRRGLRRMPSYGDDQSSDLPPALISYKQYGLDLNSITCSGNQPHYIALGGAHLHCFLHDRRMLERDLNVERGRPSPSKPQAGTAQDEEMRESTRCVRRFAPNNQRKHERYNNGHITACKISDARPNELISSWSGDHIYSFDIVKSPDARDVDDRAEIEARKTRLKDQKDRKRKRAVDQNSSGSANTMSRPRAKKAAEGVRNEDDSAVRVRYTDGETQDLLIGGADNQPGIEFGQARDLLLTEAQRQSERIAKLLVQLRKTLFDFSASLEANEAASMEHSTELTPYTRKFTSALGMCATLLPDVEEIMRSWTYPVDPDEEQVSFQNTLRRNRQATWRFVQAAGCLSRCLGGKIQTTSSAPDPRLELFANVRPAPREAKTIKKDSRFYYDFLKAIILWLNGGQDAVLQGFKRPIEFRDVSSRFPLDEGDTIDTMSEKLLSYFIDLADQNKPIIDIGTSPFERSEVRSVFASQDAAVRAFMRALDGIELRQGQGSSETITDTSDPSNTKRIMDKGAAARFWGLKVGRSLLLEAGEGVTFSFVQQAFGGPLIKIVSALENLGHEPHVISDDSDEESEMIDLLKSKSAAGSTQSQKSAHMPGGSEHGSVDVAQSLDAQASDEDDTANEDYDFGSDNDDDDDNDTQSESSEDEVRSVPSRFLGFTSSRDRSKVNIDVPYTSHTKVYKGHCNTRTVKDVNYYGLDDDYVVSGSDDGHFFIWDRKSSQIVNILQGDGEVVNVVQGHPYEPIIACSGIDSTVKIFGRGGESRDRYEAAQGINIANPGNSVHSSLRFGGRNRRARVPTNDDDNDNNEDEATTANDSHDSPEPRNGLRSRKALEKQYEIISQNDVRRHDGVGDAFVTEGMLARFAAVLQQQGFELQGDDGRTVVVDQDNCSVM